MSKFQFLAVLGVLGSLTLFSACSAKTPTSQGDSSAPSNLAADQKKGTTVKTGKVIKIGEKYFLEQTGKEPSEIDSYTLDLSNYMGKTVKATGQYSGNTLFVGQIE